MKQIICKDCIKTIKDIAKKSPPNEKITFKKGKAILGMYCDYCASLIEEKQVCYAKTVTVFPAKKEDWESEYIK